MEVIDIILLLELLLNYNFLDPFCLAQLFLVVAVLIINLEQADEKGAFIYVFSIWCKTLRKTGRSPQLAWEKTMIYLSFLLCPVENQRSIFSYRHWASSLSRSQGVLNSFQRHCWSQWHFVSKYSLWSLQQKKMLEKLVAEVLYFIVRSVADDCLLRFFSSVPRWLTSVVTVASLCLKTLRPLLLQ